MKGKFIAILVVSVGVFIVGWFIFSKLSSPNSSSGEIIAQNGIHWHTELNINILGQAQDIPAGIGLEKLPHQPLHTHDSDNIIHSEFSRIVRKDDIRLGEFFKIWGKQFNKNCIFDKCLGLEGQLKMLVNGKENNDFENYIMKDGDKIEIIFEKPVLSEVKEIAVTGAEFSFEPSQISVKAGDKVKIIFKNQGSTPHNLVIEDLGVRTKTIGKGQTDAIEFTASAPGNYSFDCSLPGHKEAGMKGVLKAE